MKNLFFLILLVSFKISTTQAQVISNPDIIKNKPVKPIGTTQKPITLQQQGERNILVPELPDLKFTAFNVTATPSTSGGITTYTLNISFTVKNDGTVAVLTDDVALQGYLSNESWITRANKDLSMTGYLTAAGGQILSSIPNRGETLAPGASKQISYSIYNKQLGTDPKPIFIITISTGANIKESDSGNNMTYMTILI